MYGVYFPQERGEGGLNVFYVLTTVGVAGSTTMPLVALPLLGVVAAPGVQYFSFVEVGRLPLEQCVRHLKKCYHLFLCILINMKFLTSVVDKR